MAVWVLSSFEVTFTVASTAVPSVVVLEGLTPVISYVSLGVLGVPGIVRSVFKTSLAVLLVLLCIIVGTFLVKLVISALALLVLLKNPVKVIALSFLGAGR